MRILVVSIGTLGDVLPFIGLAAEMRRRGHEVTLAAAQAFEHAARRAGVPFEPLMSTEDYAARFEHPRFWRPLQGVRRLFLAVSDLLRPTYDFIARNDRAGDTVVIASALALGARVAQEKLGVPVVAVHLTPILFLSRDAPPRVPFLPLPARLPAIAKWKLQTGVHKFIIAPWLSPGLNAFRESLGLRPFRKLRKWWHPASVIALFPEWFAPRQKDWPSVRHVDFPRADGFGALSDRPDPQLDAFLAAGEPPVAITFGSARFGSDALYRAAIEACAGLGKRCVILSQQPIETPPGFEGSAFAAQYAPLGDVLPRCAALIHHGGVGTVALAFAAGVPQLIVPSAFDQFDHAARVLRQGCGDWMQRSLFTAGRAEKALARLLADPQVAERCAVTAALCGRRDALVEACDMIEAEFVVERRPRRAAAPMRR